MRDWELEVGELMGGLKLCAEARNDVVRELACHFEEIYDNAREGGAGEEQAREQALESVADWKRLASEVQREKETLMTTTPFRRKVVLPGLLGFVFVVIPLWITSLLHHNGAQYVFRPIDPQHYFTFNVPWLVALPIAGAAAAWMSWRNGGSSGQRLAAGILPALTFAWMPLMGVVTAIVWLVLNAVAPERAADHAGVAEWTTRIVAFLVPWVIAPAISMAIGTLPLLWLKPHAAEEQPSSAAHA
jgi:hypothetical protein